MVFHKLYVTLVTILLFSSETKSLYFILLLHFEILMSKLANETSNLGKNVAGNIMLLGTLHGLFH
jgi:hypothetical protein